MGRGQDGQGMLGWGCARQGGRGGPDSTSRSEGAGLMDGHPHPRVTTNGLGIGETIRKSLKTSPSLSELFES